MKILSLGPDELSDWELEKLPKLERQVVYDIKKFVYWYQIGCYSGQGCAVFKDSNNDWHIISMHHCSCFGPVEDLKSAPMTLEDVITLLKNGNYTYYDSESGDECYYKELIAYLEAEDD